MTTRLHELAYRTGVVLLGVAVLALAVRPLLYPIADPDFFWHLKTGQWIWEHRSLPDSYLFSVTAPAVLSAAQRLTMTSYWLVQLAYHAAHALGGMAGIGVLRALLLVCLLASLAWRREGDILTFLGVAVPAVVLVRIYHFERPQVVSFLFCSLLLGALDRIRRPDDGRGLPAIVAAVPLIMLVWANSHGGFVVGQGVILLYLVLEGAKRLHPRLDPMPPGRLRLLLAAGGAGLLASLANPNTWRVWGLAQCPAWLTSFNMEYQSTLASWRVSNSPVFPTYWLLLALVAVAAAASWRKPDITRLALMAIMGWYSFTQVRHLGFFFVAAVPAVSAGFSCRGFRTAGRVVALAAALVVAGFFLPGDLVDLARAKPSRVRVSGLVFPTDAADFLDANGVRGDLYGFYGWGGYLLWRLAPARVFIDGRVSDRNVIDMARALDDGESASVGGVPDLEGRPQGVPDPLRGHSRVQFEGGGRDTAPLPAPGRSGVGSRLRRDERRRLPGERRREPGGHRALRVLPGGIPGAAGGALRSGRQSFPRRPLPVDRPGGAAHPPWALRRGPSGLHRGVVHSAAQRAGPARPGGPAVTAWPGTGDREPPPGGNFRLTGARGLL